MQNCRLLVLQSAGRKDFARLVVVAIDNENIIEYSSERTWIGLVELWKLRRWNFYKFGFNFVWASQLDLFNILNYTIT